eukprot:UN09643
MGIWQWKLSSQDKNKFFVMNLSPLIIGYVNKDLKLLEFNSTSNNKFLII